MNPAVKKFLSALLTLTPQSLYLVGGSVRDVITGIDDIKDIDLVMASGSESVAREFADKIGGSFFFLDEERKITRVVKREEPDVFQFDFTNFEGADLRADLGRRDFTINAMAVDLREFVQTGVRTVIDFFSGAEDARAKSIRMTRPGVFDEDPLRLLRAVRFAVTLGFRIDPETAARIRSRAPLITNAAPERIRDEFFRILSERGAGGYLALLDDLGLLPQLLPEMNELTGFAPGRYHIYDVRTHSIKAAASVDAVLDDLPQLAPEYAPALRQHLDASLETLVPRKAALRFACLLHDIAKPDTFSQDQDGRIHFFGHDNLGAEKAKNACRRFRLSRDTERLVTSIIRQHMRLFNLSTPGGPTKSAMYRYCRDLGDAVPESLVLAQADARATYDIMPREKFTDTEKPMGSVLRYYFEKFLRTETARLVTGQDLIDRGLKPGPRFRGILEEIRERQAAGEFKDRDDALRFLDRLKQQGK